MHDDEFGKGLHRFAIGILSLLRGLRELHGRKTRLVHKRLGENQCRLPFLNLADRDKRLRLLVRSKVVKLHLLGKLHNSLASRVVSRTLVFSSRIT